jgi:hypothetical protein
MTTGNKLMFCPKTRKSRGAIVSICCTVGPAHTIKMHALIHELQEHINRNIEKVCMACCQTLNTIVFAVQIKFYSWLK